MPLRELRDVIVVRHASHVSNSSSVSPVQGFGDRSVISMAIVLRSSTIIARNVLRVSLRYRTAGDEAPRGPRWGAVGGACGEAR